MYSSNIKEDVSRKSAVEINASGNAENALSAYNSSYSNVMKNPATFGVCPELAYSDAYKVDSVTIKFEISDEYINMILPLETKFDSDKNLLYTESNALGSFCTGFIKPVVTLVNDKVDYLNYKNPFQKIPIMHDGDGYWAEGYSEYIDNKWVLKLNKIGENWRL